MVFGGGWCFEVGGVIYFGGGMGGGEIRRDNFFCRRDRVFFWGGMCVRRGVAGTKHDES